MTMTALEALTREEILNIRPPDPNTAVGDGLFVGARYGDIALTADEARRLCDMAIESLDLRAKLKAVEHAVAQRLDASHDECCQREASAVQRAQAAEAELAKVRDERDGMLYALMGLHKAVLQLAEHFDKPITDDNVPLWLALNSAQSRVANMLAGSQPQAEREKEGQ